MSAATPIKLGRRCMPKHLPSSICGIYTVFAVFLIVFLYPMTMITVSPPVNHQVFISFRGDQLRYNFVSHLTDAFERQGIKYFIDKDEQPGKDLKHLLVRIEESNIALAIFSTRYPESKWCMNELVKMKKCADEGKVHIIPIFFKVEARHVRKPTRENEFGENFWRLLEVSDKRDSIQEWRESLECVSNKMGLALKDKSSEAEFKAHCEGGAENYRSNWTRGRAKAMIIPRSYFTLSIF